MVCQIHATRRLRTPDLSLPPTPPSMSGVPLDGQHALHARTRSGVCNRDQGRRPSFHIWRIPSTCLHRRRTWECQHPGPVSAIAKTHGCWSTVNRTSLSFLDSQPERAGVGATMQWSHSRGVDASRSSRRWGRQQGWSQSSYASRNDRSNHWALHPDFQAQFKLKSPCKYRHHEGMMQSVVREHGSELTRIAITA